LKNSKQLLAHGFQLYKLYNFKLATNSLYPTEKKLKALDLKAKIVYTFFYPACYGALKNQKYERRFSKSKKV